MARTKPTRPGAVPGHTRSTDPGRRASIADDRERPDRPRSAPHDAIVPSDADLENAVGEFPSEQEGEWGAAAADASTLALWDTNQLDLFSSERTSTAASVIPSGTGGQNVSTTRPPIETPVAHHVAAPTTPPVDAAASYARGTSLGIVTAMVVILSILTFGRPPLSLPQSASTTLLPAVLLPQATITTALESRTTAPSSDDERRLNETSPANRETLSRDSRLREGPSRAAGVSRPGPVRSELSQSAPSRRSASPVPSVRATALPRAASVKPAAPILSDTPPFRLEPISAAPPPASSPAADVMLLRADPSAAMATTPTLPAGGSTAPAATPRATSTSPILITDAGAVQVALGRYRSAFSDLSVGAALSIWPTVDAKALGRAFERLEEQAIEFDHCDIVVTSVRAVAACGGRARYVPKVGNKGVHVEPRQWKFHLRKADEAWLIDSVSAR